MNGGLLISNMDRYETENYKVVVATLATETEGYQIVNKSTGVVEYEDVILPRTLDSLASLQQEITRANEDFENSKPSKAAKSILRSIGGDSPNGDGSIH